MLLLTTGCQAVTPLQEWTLEAEEIGTLGTDPGDVHSAFYRPRDLAVDGNGHLFVLDSSNHRVQRFDAQGRWQATVGGHGQGPGHLADPEGFWVYPDGELVVADTGNQRIQRFGPAGEFISSRRVDYLPLDVVGTPRRLFVLRLPPPGNVFGPDEQPLVEELDRDGTRLVGHVEPEPREPGVIYFLANTLRIAAAPSGGFALADTHIRSRIRVYGPTGVLETSIPTLYKADSLAPLGTIPRVLTDASLERVAKTAMALTWDPQRALFWVIAGYVDRDQDGTWIIGTEIMRYDRDGAYRGSVMLPYHAIGVAPSADRTVWILDIEGVVHHVRIADPEASVTGPLH